MIPYGKVFQGNVFQGNLGRQPSGRVMDGPGSGFGPMRPTGYAQPIQEPSQGTPYGMPRPSDFPDSRWKPAGQPPQWNVGDDIRRPPSNPVRPPMPPPPLPGRIMDGPGSGFTYPRPPEDRQYAGGTPGFDERTGRYNQGFGDDIRRAPSSSGRAQPIPPNTDTNWQPDPEEYRRSVAAERARAAKMDAEAAAKRQKMLQDRQGVKFPEYENRIYDPIVIQNEMDKRAAQAKAEARGETPRKTQGELDREESNRSHARQNKAREDIARAYPNLPPNERYRMESYVMAGNSLAEAYKNSGAEFAYSQRTAMQQEQERKIREFQSPEYRASTINPEPGMSGRPGWGPPRSSNPPTATRWR